MEEAQLAASSIIMGMTAFLGLFNYVLSSLAIYKIAKVEKINNPWLAWVPVAQSYILIKIAGGKAIYMILAVTSLVTGGPLILMIQNIALLLGIYAISLAWSIYALMMYNRICDRYDVNILLFVLSFLASFVTNIKPIAGLYIPLLLVGFYANFKLYKNACKGPRSTVKVSSRVVLSTKKKKRK